MTCVRSSIQDNRCFYCQINMSYSLSPIEQWQGGPCSMQHTAPSSRHKSSSCSRGILRIGISRCEGTGWAGYHRWRGLERAFQQQRHRRETLGSKRWLWSPLKDAYWVWSKNGYWFYVDRLEKFGVLGRVEGEIAVMEVWDFFVLSKWCLALYIKEKGHSRRAIK